MRQSITTKYFGATNSRGSRVKATSSSGLTVYVGWDDALSADENHHAAARRLCERYDWHGTLEIGGARKGEGNVYVFIASEVIHV